MCVDFQVSNPEDWLWWSLWVPSNSEYCRILWLYNSMCLVRDGITLQHFFCMGLTENHYNNLVNRLSLLILSETESMFYIIFLLTPLIVYGTETFLLFCFMKALIPGLWSCSLFRSYPLPHLAVQALCQMEIGNTLRRCCSRDIPVHCWMVWRRSFLCNILNSHFIFFPYLLILFFLFTLIFLFTILLG